ncbi:MAG: hypothetical protein EXS35_12890 [Pedosphaera sp.]|nr:hypothetical protein [Pedosphaera sp.]
MSTITAILEADADGTLHLPLPADLRRGKVKVVATLESEREATDRPTREAALAALRQLQARGTFKKITDPVAWQREIRVDRPLPGRD